MKATFEVKCEMSMRDLKNTLTWNYGETSSDIFDSYSNMLYTYTYVVVYFTILATSWKTDNWYKMR